MSLGSELRIRQPISAQPSPEVKATVSGRLGDEVFVRTAPLLVRWVGGAHGMGSFADFKVEALFLTFYC